MFEVWTVPSEKKPQLDFVYTELAMLIIIQQSGEPLLIFT